MPAFPSRSLALPGSPEHCTSGGRRAAAGCGATACPCAVRPHHLRDGAALVVALHPQQAGRVLKKPADRGHQGLGEDGCRRPLASQGDSRGLDPAPSSAPAQVAVEAGDTVGSAPFSWLSLGGGLGTGLRAEFTSGAAPVLSEPPQPWPRARAPQTCGVSSRWGVQRANYQDLFFPIIHVCVL